jgi:hypothetical protein
MMAMAGWTGPLALGPPTGPPHVQLVSSAQVNVAVVIDFGSTSHHTPRVRTDCLKVAAGANGSTALAKAVAALSLPAPNYNDSGLLCSIGGYPSSGCGVAVGNGYAYWSYWHGGSSWSYASVGPAEWTVTSDDVEGWRFENPGSASPNDPPPASPAAFAGACPDGVTVAASPSQLSSETISTGEDVLLTVAGLAIIGLVAASLGRWRRRPLS